jgi:XTP/dITP diphosphohydrolase
MYFCFMNSAVISINPNDQRLVAFARLLNIMDDLREKCPWDNKQTFESLRHLTIEETYELSDAIIQNDMEGLKGEIGDLMLHMVFYAKIGSETEAFNITDILNAICDKLVHRHPHIYGDVEANTEEEVKANWEKIKLQEGKKSVLQGVPNTLPALIKAMRVQEKVKGIGFDWDSIDDVKNKVIEEFTELHEAQLANDSEQIQAEFGDVLFSMINYARFLNISAEDALETTNRKFIRRFMLMEELIAQSGRSIEDMALAEMDSYWETAKQSLKNR